MEYDLRRELSGFFDEPVPSGGDLPLQTVARRVRRGRAVRAAGVGTAAAATVVGLAVTVQAAPWAADPVPPAVLEATTPSPTQSDDPGPEPTGTPGPEPTGNPDPAPTSVPDPSPEPTPIEPPVVATPPLVGVTTDGSVVTLDPQTGAVLATVHTGVPTSRDPAKVAVDVAPDGAAVYVSHASDTGTDDLTILRVDLVTGAAETVGAGVNPAVSPDGGTLAYAGPDPDRPDEGRWGLNLLDLGTGTVRHVTEPDNHGEAWIWTPVWSPDGTSIHLPTWRGLLRVSPRAGSLAEGTTLLPGTGEQPGSTARLGDGSLVVHLAAGGYLPDPATMRLVVVDATTGDVSDAIDGAAGLAMGSLAGSPDGSAVVGLGNAITVTSTDHVAGPTRLLRWDGGESLRGLAEAPDLLAVGW